MADKVNTITGEVVTGDEYVEMMLQNYEEAMKLYKEAGDQLGRARQLLFNHIEVLERVREAKVVLEFNRREDGK